MKKILIMIVCSVSLWCACTEEKVPSIYSGPDGINFYYDQAGPYDSDPYPNSEKTGSLMSSRQSDTLWYKILVMGNLSNKERRFSLKQSSLSALDCTAYYTGLTPQVKVAVAGVNYVAFDDPEMENYYVIPPDSSQVLIPVIVKYDPAYAGKSVDFRLHFEIVPNEEISILDPRFYRATCKFKQWGW